MGVVKTSCSLFNDYNEKNSSIPDKNGTTAIVANTSIGRF
jgi:hypothetical protein